MGLLEKYYCCHTVMCYKLLMRQKSENYQMYPLITVYANYFYDTSVINFSNSFITYRESFRICIGHDRRTNVIGIDCNNFNKFHFRDKLYKLHLCLIEMQVHVPCSFVML